MQVTQQCQGDGAAWNVVGCLFRRESPPVHPILPSGKVHSKFSTGLRLRFFVSHSNFKFYIHLTTPNFTKLLYHSKSINIKKIML